MIDENDSTILQHLADEQRRNIVTDLFERLDRYNVTWQSPSRDSLGSMPLGNGDIGLNVWVEQDGDLLFYIGKTDAWSEHARLLKLGRIRVSLTPTPFQHEWHFVQRLKLREGAIEIEAGEGERQVKLLLWVDAHQPVIHVEIEGASAYEVKATLEVWRDKSRTIEGRELHSAYGLIEAPFPVVESPDTVLHEQNEQVTWFHRNEHSIWPETMRVQGLDTLVAATEDPLLYRTFGGVIKGTRLVKQDDYTLSSRESHHSYHLMIYTLTLQCKTEKEWQEQIQQVIHDSEQIERERAWSAHCAWWQAFWERSWIFVSGSEEAELVTRGYLLQRFINACGGRGAFPIKFNGSIFTVDNVEPEEAFDADYRRWGGPYWFQNTRHPYWSMLATGDFDLMQSLFRMYLNALPLAQKRTAHYFQHEGAFFPETMYFWGAYATDNYGWDRSNKAPHFVVSTYMRYYYQAGLELSALMLDYYTYMQDQAFVKQFLLPLATQVIRFYDQHYPRGKDGKLRLEPAQSIENWHEAINPLPDIAGLLVVLEGLLALPEEIVESGQRSEWQRLYQEIPALPLGEQEGHKVLLPAEQVMGPIMNSENPELYAIFPYRLYGVGKPELQIGQETFHRRLVKQKGCWRQDGTQAAYLGLTEVARENVVHNFTTAHSRSRFPAFWGPNLDWHPDQDHGGNAMTALQTMLLQSVGPKILLFPAWPAEWNVDFKLHAPQNTIVEGKYEDGKLLRLHVSPKEREDDVIQ